MSKLYADNHRSLQDKFDTRKLADRLDEVIINSELSPEDTAFIEAQDMFFLSTIDNEGRPTVSYKGGAPGFVRVIDNTTLAFPSYDGNGMFYSMGNITGEPKIGMLFINFQVPSRLRVQGEATIHLDDPLLEEYKEADLIVRVNLSQVWPNCPRYIHPHTKQKQSHYVPMPEQETPFPGWKRIDFLQDVLPEKDQGRPEQEGGIQTIEEWMGDVQKGEG